MTMRLILESLLQGNPRVYILIYWPDAVFEPNTLELLVEFYAAGLMCL